MAKFKKLDKTPDFRVYAKGDLPNLHKKGKPYYANEWGITVPFCPFCNKYAYESTHCVFCGAEFEEPTKEDIEKMKKANNEITVEYKNIMIQQVATSLWLYEGGKLISHMALGNPMTEKELLDMAKGYAREIEIEDNFDDLEDYWDLADDYEDN